MNISFASLRIGEQYSRSVLAERWGYLSFHALARGVVTPTGTNKIILFVTAEKQASATQYSDRLSDGHLEWEGPRDHFGEKRILGAETTGDEIHVFFRDRHHSDFTYLGHVRLSSFELNKSRPSTFQFRVGRHDRSWTKAEASALVDDYFRMLLSDLRGEQYNKSQHHRDLGRFLNNRTDSSITRKHQNVSAVLIRLGWPYIPGYKPLSNYQAQLEQIVEDRANGHQELHEVLRQSVGTTVQALVVPDLLQRLVDPPDAEPPPRYDELRERQHQTSRLTNWLQVEAGNRALGRAGEQFVVDYERERLRRARAHRLARRVEHVAATLGDGEGFDVRSFELNGSERLIEVKTTAYGKEVPFFLSRHELAVSRERAAVYHLYRLFTFVRDPRFYSLKGAIDETCYLDAMQYAATIRHRGDE